MPVSIIQESLKSLPSSPGVYRMLDENGAPLYVGKARDLKKRVTYYTQIDKLPYRLKHMVYLTAAMEFVTMRNESEAFLLEASYVRELQPRFNIMLKDDKSFPYVMLTMDHDFPRVTKHRGARKKEHLYFGPYTSALDVKKTITLLQKTFRVRPCQDSFFEARTRPCLEYQIKRCSAPCVNYISKEEYAVLVQQVIDFFAGKTDMLRTSLVRQMEIAAERMEYEKAANLRDRLQALSTVQSNSSLHHVDLDEADAIGLVNEGNRYCIQIFFIRQGQPRGNRAYFPKVTEESSPGEVLEAFISDFYQTNQPAATLLVSHDVDNYEMIENALSTIHKKKIEICVPQRGRKAELMSAVCENAKNALTRKLSESAAQEEILLKVAQAFGLEEPPERIEVYDNSHIMGRHPVGAMIVAGPEGFRKNAYRKFNVKPQKNLNEAEEITGGDDYDILRQVLTRRLTRLQSPENEADTPNTWPDLMLIDGGPGQMSVAQQVIQEMGIQNLAIVCIAKGPDRNAGRETFYRQGREPFQLQENDPVLYYLQRLRDEAHRFAITSHRAKRAKSMYVSKLDEIPNIGPKRKKALLNRFGSARAVENASIEEIASVEGINRKTAEMIYNFLHQ